MELLSKRLASLLCVKSIVTIVLTGVFAYMTVMGNVSSDQFLTVFTVVIAFYFGVQSEKKAAQVVEPVAQIAQKEQAPNG
jgi:hypothetical protein